MPRRFCIALISRSALPPRPRWSAVRFSSAQPRHSSRSASSRMIRKAFKMSVHPDQHAEYARRHQPIWKELEDTLLAHGVRTYSIFLDEQTSELFGYVEI